MTTTNVAQTSVDENLPQLLDSRGVSHVTNVPEFDKEDFTSWKRLKFNDFKSLEGEKVNGTFTRLKCLLNDLENNGVIIPQAEVNATFVNSLQRKWLSMNQTQRANNSIKNNSLASLYGKYNYEEDVEEDQRTSNEFMVNLNAEYHERALLENQKRFYKRFRRVGSARKPIDKSKEICFTCGKPGHFQNECPSKKSPHRPLYPQIIPSTNPNPTHHCFTQTSSQNTGNHQKDYKRKYIGLKGEMTVLTKRIENLTKRKSEKGKNKKGKSDKGLIAELFDWDEESVSSKDEGTTKIKADKDQIILQYTTLESFRERVERERVCVT
ncbi:retrovirus-related pol polyprotein from transposon TNT 1-94 [Tanacetum coccineum]|uniref:Retrovirus-related pol polyprotein from transposon TNT 1-94 n=1 Tax=Tanacetum coccineum TaxID=301880 RepID=A0ABQ5AZJ5_9ASTR